MPVDSITNPNQQRDTRKRDLALLDLGFNETAREDAPPAPDNSLEKTGESIGRYQLISLLGSGGFGNVWLAEQTEPIHRKVAMKVIKPGMDSREVIARFEAERQALALMDHPNIARVLDAGTSANGRPYFALELVQGAPITTYCDAHRVGVRERLTLFIAVCQAVQHAHQKAILHRDLKPSNVLVAEVDGQVVPKVIDFGIAKALGVAAEDVLKSSLLLTRTGVVIGTPHYMSPEQAGSAPDVDTRSDIYALGAILYELLTGTPPLGSDTRRVAFDELLRRIREHEPLRPSLRVTKAAADSSTEVAMLRGTDTSHLVRCLRGDLDWIVMKALEKDPARRYETANGLAQDVKRYMVGEAISARPPSKLYRFQKTFRRNQPLFVGVGIILVLLVAGLVTVSTFLASERQARRESDSDRQKAQQVTKFLEEMLEGAGPAVANGRDPAIMREILDRTAKRVGVEMANQPTVEAELRNLIGTLYQRIGDYRQAEEMHRAALAIRREVFGPESQEVAASLNDLGVELLALHNLSETAKVVGEALAIRRRLHGDENAATATSLNDLAVLYREQGRTEEAEAMATKALGTRRKLFGEEHLAVADSLRNLSIILGSQKKWPEAEAMAREVLEIRRRLLEPDHPWLASSLGDIAWAAGAQGKLDEAEALEQEALAIRQRVLPDPNPDLAKSLYIVGDRMRQKGNFKDATSLLTAAVSMQRKVPAGNISVLLMMLNSLGSTLNAQGKSAESEALQREAVVLWHTRTGDEDPQTLYAARNLASTLKAEGKLAESELIQREVLLALRQRAGDEDPQTLYSLYLLGITFEAQRKFEEAEAVHREALASWRNRAGDLDPETLYAMRNLAQSLEAAGKFPEASTLHRDALASWRKLRGNEDPQTLYTLSKLALTLEAEGKWEATEVVRSEALAIWRRRGENETADALNELKGLVRVLNLQKKFSEAEKHLTDALTPTFVQQPASVDFLDLRMNLLVRQERWKEAAVDAALALKHQPADQVRYHCLAPLLVVTGDESAYKQLCQEMLRRFGDTTHSYIADRVAKSCLISPHSDVDLYLVDKLTDTALTAGESDPCMPLFKMAKGLSMLRLRNFEKAIEWTEKSLNSRFSHPQAQGYAILAMAHWQLGHKDEARAMLAQGNALALPIPSDDPAARPGEKPLLFHETPHHARLLARIQLNEAAALIQPDSSPEKMTPKEN